MISCNKCKKFIKKSIYAITEFSRDKINHQNIISCPGCYPTSIQLPLIPLVRKKMIDTNNIVIDAKSGYSGAGKNVKKKFAFKNLFDSVSAYNVGSHRHMAEIDQELTKISKKKINVFFTPHLIPMFRGILTTIYLETYGKYNAKKIYKETIFRYFHNLKAQFSQFGLRSISKSIDEIENILSKNEFDNLDKDLEYHITSFEWISIKKIAHLIAEKFPGTEIVPAEQKDNVQQDKKNDPDRLEMKKYCRFCRKHIPHKEVK